MDQSHEPDFEPGDYVRLTRYGLQRMRAAGLLYGWDGVSPKLLCDTHYHPKGDVAILEPPRTFDDCHGVIVPLVFLQKCEDFPLPTRLLS